jgi:hypothetical protein
MLLGLPAVQAIGVEWRLVTPAEDARDDAAPYVPKSTPPAVSGAPVITVKQPDVSRPLHNPMTFDIQFSAAQGAMINRSTLRVKTGSVSTVTQRLLGHATWTASGLFAADADVPTGNHRISVSIADNLGKVRHTCRQPKRSEMRPAGAAVIRSGVSPDQPSAGGVVEQSATRLVNARGSNRLRPPRARSGWPPPCLSGIV